MQQADPTCCLPASVEEKDRFLLLFFVQERCCHIVTLTSCGQCNKHWNATVQRLLSPPSHVSPSWFLAKHSRHKLEAREFFHLTMTKSRRRVLLPWGQIVCRVSEKLEMNPWKPRLQDREKLIVRQLVRKFPTFYEPWRIITHLLAVYRVIIIHSTPTLLRSLLLLPSHLLLGLLRVFLCISLLPRACHMPYASNHDFLMLFSAVTWYFFLPDTA
jgi:hypothetical protein